MEIDMDGVVRLARGTAAGMVFLHAQGIIHRDIACRNLLVRADHLRNEMLNLKFSQATKNNKGELTIKITDFGMARFDRSGPLVAGQAFGPLKWMAPEALNGEYVKKTDVWSYGVTLVEILTKGNDPYPGKSPMEAALKVRDEQGCPAIPPDTPMELEALMKDCWKQNAEDRPSFDDIVTRLDQFHFKLKRNAPNMKPIADGKIMVVNEYVEAGLMGNKAWKPIANLNPKKK